LSSTEFIIVAGHRDPIGEEGGVNLYGFVGNDPIRKWDVLGKHFDFYSCTLECDAGLRSKIIDATAVYISAMGNCTWLYKQPWRVGSCVVLATGAYKLAVAGYDRDHKKCLDDCCRTYPPKTP